MSRALLILWIATLGADRVDLLGGAGPLLLRPVLLLIPPMIVLELLRLSRRGRSIRLPVSAAIFFAGLTLLIAVLILSTMYSQEVGLGFRRLALLIVEAYAAFLAVIFLINRPDPERIVLRAARDR